MNSKCILLTLIVAACCLLVVQPIQAQNSEDQTVIYQTSFASDPRWVTNNPSNDYWVPNMGMYHFSLEPSTGNYAYIPVTFDSGSFTFDYDVIITRIDEGATFRMGLSGAEMDPSKGPNTISMFTNAKYGQIMWLHLVTTGNKLLEANSQHEATELGPTAYNGPTVKYDVNKTYHVTVDYDDRTKILSMKVKELQSGKDVWGYFINNWENLRGMNRIFIGSKGDYGMMGIYAQGYIDNVRLTVPSSASVTAAETLPVTPGSTAAATTSITKSPTPKMTTPTPYPTGTQQSPSSGILPVIALGICGMYCGLSVLKKH